MRSFAKRPFTRSASTVAQFAMLLSWIACGEDSPPELEIDFRQDAGDVGSHRNDAAVDQPPKFRDDVTFSDNDFPTGLSGECSEINRWSVQLSGEFTLDLSDVQVCAAGTSRSMTVYADETHTSIKEIVVVKSLTLSTNLTDGSRVILEATFNEQQQTGEDRILVATALTITRSLAQSDLDTTFRWRSAGDSCEAELQSAARTGNGQLRFSGSLRCFDEPHLADAEMTPLQGSQLKLSSSWFLVEF